MSTDPAVEPTAPPEEPTRRFALVSSAGESFALDLSVVREAVPARAFTRLPGAPAYVRGLVNVRGRVVTVVDLSARLGSPPASDRPGHRLLVLQHRGREVGLAVENVVRTLSLAESSLTPLPSGEGDDEARFLTHTGELDRSAFRVIDTEELLGPVFG